ncbi:MAG: hypothetical protein JNL71_06260 [Rhodospirillales bacterium]|nr:hypothetical protein [Rhodospirillales bacterium]
MDYRTIAAAWIVGLSIVAGALYFTTLKRGGGEYAGIVTGTRIPLLDELPQAPRESAFEPLDTYPGDR